MAKFLILTSPNKSNIGTIAERSEDFYKPSFYKISDEELNQFMEMSVYAKSAFIAEKIEAQTITEVKKKIVAPVVVVESQAESVSVEMPEVEIEKPLNEPLDEPINEPINEVKVSHIGLTSPTVKAKGRPKKTN
jgi:hypothetical protein